MESLEDILQLPCVDFRLKRLLPDARGIYFLVVQSSELIYLGKTCVSFKQRWQQHHVGTFVRRILRRASEYGWEDACFKIHYLEQNYLTEVQMHELEQCLIAEFCPIWNGMKGGKVCEPILDLFGFKKPDNIPLSSYELEKIEARQLRQKARACELYLEYVERCNAEGVNFARDEAFRFC
jgi:hypothetical protein